MTCDKCGGVMTGGAPHCETIKSQYECECGNIVTESYTPEEMAVNTLLTYGLSPKEARALLAKHDGDLNNAIREVRETELRRNAGRLGADADDFAKVYYQTETVEALSDADLKALSETISDLADQADKLTPPNGE